MTRQRDWVGTEYHLIHKAAALKKRIGEQILATIIQMGLRSFQRFSLQTKALKLKGVSAEQFDALLLIYGHWSSDPALVPKLCDGFGCSLLVAINQEQSCSIQTVCVPERSSRKPVL